MRTMNASADAPSRRGGWLALLGGVVCAIGYVLPWVRYHVAYAGSVKLPNGVVGHAWSGLRNMENHLLPIPYAVSRPLMLVVAALPLLLALVAAGAGALARMQGAARAPRGLSWAYLVSAALGTSALLFMTYALDLWNLRGEATDVSSWESPPSLEPGIFLAYAGVVAILAGWFLLSGRPTREV